MESRLYLTYVETPIGRLMLLANADALRMIRFVPQRERPRTVRENEMLQLVRRELEEFFAGRLDEFTVRLAVHGSPFQRQVWDAVRAIPFGQTRSYRQIAQSIGAPQSARAVGAANANNPWPIIVPCHRVVGSGGRLTGYAGGLERKEWLLQHEGALAPA